MNFNFKKVSAVLTCGIMAVSGIGFAAAASYPSPFVVSGSADVAVVYGAGASSLDIVQAGNIQSNLQSSMGTSTGATTGSTSGGDSVKIEKSATKFRLGFGIEDVVSTAFTDDSPNNGLPILLADGEYVDDDNDENSYIQKIDLINASSNTNTDTGGVLRMFDDDDYKDDTPTIGFKYTSGDHVLNYTLDFTDTPEWGDLDSTNIEIMGKSYFILSHTINTTINMLDAAQTTTLEIGETTTVNNHEVSVNFIGGTGTGKEVVLTVDGTNTNTLGVGETQKLSGGDYVGIKTILNNDYAGGPKSVEFSIGTGKLVLKHGVDVEINDVTISDLTTYISNTNTDLKIDKIVIEWDAEDDLFVTPDQSKTMPGFEAVELSFAGMLYPTEEVIQIRGGSTTYVTLENFPLKDSVEDINILYGDSKNFTGIGKDSTHQFRTSDSATGLVFDKDTDDWFLVSYNDGSNAESYLLRATSFGLVSGSTTANKTTIQYRKDGAWVDLKTDAQLGDVISIGNVELTIDDIQRSSLNQLNVSTTSANIEFDRMYSKEGMQVYVPWPGNNQATEGEINVSASSALGPINQPAHQVIFSEEDDNGNIGGGKNITAVLGWNSATTKEVYVSDVGNESLSFVENGDNTKKWISQIHSALATDLEWDKSGDQYELTLTYHGDESYGEVYLNAPGTTITAGTSGTTGSATQLGNVLVKDTEVSSVSSKNLIIIGGSCINSAAATALGVSTHTCGADFTTATGVGSGQFLIKGVSGAYATGKLH